MEILVGALHVYLLKAKEEKCFIGQASPKTRCLELGLKRKVL